jgi:cleavage and polyadenylation specificity factor subunit 3
MTHPTKAIYKLLLSDFVKVSHQGEMLFSEQDLMKSLDKIELIGYHQEMEHNGIKFWCYNAGHVLGAAMFMVDIGGTTVLYTGDFSRQEDRHLLGAETPTVKPDVLIIESTYGIQVHEKRKDREQRFTKMVHDVVIRGGRCLIPVFALGRAQELLLILDEYWETHPKLQKIPIYYASSLAQKCLKVFKQYIESMNEKIRKQFDISNPFLFKHISNLKDMESFEDSGPCVIMASPGMLQSGISQELFEKWCSDGRNGVVLPGYCVEGTLAKKIMSEPAEIKLSNGQTVPLNMTVKSISFSAHSDREQTEEFIEAAKPTHVVLVHGDSTNMTRLKQALQSKFEKLQVYTPKNTQVVEIMFRGEKTAKVIGKLTENVKDGNYISGILVQKDFKSTLVSKEELKVQTEITYTGVTQNLTVPKPSFDFEKALKERYLCEIEKGDNFHMYKIGENVKIIYDVHEKKDQLTLHWNTSTDNDLIADSILQILLGTEEQIHSATEASLMQTVYLLLSERFKEIEFDTKTMSIHLVFNETKVRIDKNGKVKDCEDEKIISSLNVYLRRIFMSLFPLPTLDEITCQDMLLELQ